MAQYIDLQYQEKAESKPLNQRFLDITGPSIMQGFRLIKGEGAFTLTLDKGGYTSSIAITPSGAKVEETTLLPNVLTVLPNTDTSLRRVDSVYLVYQFGTPNEVATYKIVEGTSVPAENPNRKTHLLLGYVYVPAGSAAIRSSDIVQVPYGFSKLEVAGSALFHGPVVFDQKVTFSGGVEGDFPTGGGGAGGTLIERLPLPLVATEGQTEFTLPSPYTMNTQTLFVYKNGQLIPPSEWMEVSTTKFRFYDPCMKNDKIWAFWYVGINSYSVKEHNHDDLYYRKYEIANRSVRSATDYFAGPNGRVITHNLGTLNYVIIAVTPTEKTNAVGTISTDKRENEIVVYNDGAYRGKFDLSYIVKSPYPETSSNYQASDFTVESNRYHPQSGVFEEVIYRRRNGTMFMRSTFNQLDQKQRFTRLRVEYFNEDGLQIYQTKVWAFTYDESGSVKLKNRIS